MNRKNSAAYGLLEEPIYIGWDREVCSLGRPQNQVHASARYYANGDVDPEKALHSFLEPRASHRDPIFACVD